MTSRQAAKPSSSSIRCRGASPLAARASTIRVRAVCGSATAKARTAARARRTRSRQSSPLAAAAEIRVRSRRAPASKAARKQSSLFAKCS